VAERSAQGDPGPRGTSAGSAAEPGPRVES
jgi:hypothetical protein